MTPEIIKTTNYVEVIGHYSDKVLCAKLTLLADLCAIEHGEGYAKFNISDIDKLKFIDSKLDFLDELTPKEYFLITPYIALCKLGENNSTEYLKVLSFPVEGATYSIAINAANIQISHNGTTDATWTYPAGDPVVGIALNANDNTPAYSVGDTMSITISSSTGLEIYLIRQAYVEPAIPAFNKIFLLESSDHITLCINGTSVDIAATRVTPNNVTLSLSGCTHIPTIYIYNDYILDHTGLAPYGTIYLSSDNLVGTISSNTSLSFINTSGKVFLASTQYGMPQCSTSNVTSSSGILLLGLKDDSSSSGEISTSMQPLYIDNVEQSTKPFLLSCAVDAGGTLALNNVNFDIDADDLYFTLKAGSTSGSYPFEEGMTWADWVASPYNQSAAFISGNQVYFGAASYITGVTATDTIQAARYLVSTGGGSN